MARYYATVKGNKGEASRLGSASSGMRFDANGWNVGVIGFIQPDPRDEESDVIDIHITGGSNSTTHPVAIMQVRHEYVTFRAGDITVTVDKAGNVRTEGKDELA